MKMAAIGERGGIEETARRYKKISAAECHVKTVAVPALIHRLLKKSAGEVRVRPTLQGKRERRVRAAPMPFTCKARSGIR